MEWAALQFALGNVYRDLRDGDRQANLKQAVDYYQASLLVYTRAEFPIERAASQNNCGNAYRDLLAGSHSANLQAAIACYEEALQIFQELSMQQNVQGVQENIEKARIALQVLE